MKVKHEYYCEICGESYTTQAEAIACESTATIEQPFQKGEKIYIFPRYEQPVIETVEDIIPFRHGWLIHTHDKYLMSKDGPSVNDFYFWNEKDVSDCKVTYEEL